jgi:predicted amidohydrolase YtcJ
VGQPCDFILLDKNPMDISKGELRELKVLATFKAGKDLAKY